MHTPPYGPAPSGPWPGDRPADGAREPTAAAGASGPPGDGPWPYGTPRPYQAEGYEDEGYVPPAWDPQIHPPPGQAAPRYQAAPGYQAADYQAAGYGGYGGPPPEAGYDAAGFPLHVPDPAPAGPGVPADPYGPADPYPPGEPYPAGRPPGPGVAEPPPARPPGGGGTGDDDGGQKRRLEVRWRRRVGTLVVVLAALATLALVGHRLLPDVLGVGSLLDTFLPWIGVPIAVLVLVAAISRTWRGTAAVVVAVVAWSALFVPPMLRSGPGGVPDLRIVSHNVNESNKDPAGTARDLLAAGGDVVVLQEVTGHFIDGAGPLLSARYPFHYYPAYQQSSPDQDPEFGVWSDVPITSPQLVQVAPGLVDAMRLTLTTKVGPVELYDVHLVSPSLNHTGYAKLRDNAMQGLVNTLASDTSPRVILSGDFNTAATDRQFSTLAHRFTDAQITAGSGLGLTYPSSFPLVAIDHVLTRGLTPIDAGVLPRTASDHRPIFANLRFT